MLLSHSHTILSLLQLKHEEASTESLEFLMELGSRINIVIEDPNACLSVALQTDDSQSVLDTSRKGTIREPSQLVFVGHGGALVESMPFDRRVVGLNPDLAAT